MAIIKYDKNNLNDIYDDGSIEDELLRYYRDNDESININEEKFFYTTTNIRENIVNWYPFTKNDTILELGAGLGCVTGSLCKKAKKVISVEQSRRRAEVLYNRHKKYDNLEVHATNFKNLDLKEKVDYIVFIGVFEYTKMFYNCDDSFDRCLQDMKKYLKDDGKIIIAIENRYGMKYVFGGLEDHYRERYLGLKGYDDYDIQTFGKEEITNLLERNGYDKIKFSYPFPDYKLPSIIYTDERLPLDTEIGQLPIYRHISDVYTDDYRKFVKGFIDNKQFGFFSNSFFIEAGFEKSKLSDVIYAKAQPYRNDSCNVFTILDNKNNIYKIPNTEESNKHLIKNVDIHNKIAELGIDVCKITSKDNKVFSVQHVDGKIVTEIINQYAIEKNKTKIEEEIDNYVKLLNKISKTVNNFKSNNKKVFKYYKDKKVKVLKLSLLDLHMSNIIKDRSKYIIIDQEWMSDNMIPTNYMLYFSIKYLYEWSSKFRELFDVDYFYKKYNISNKDIEIYGELGNEIFNNEIKSIDSKKMEIITNQGIIVTDNDIIESKSKEYEQEIANRQSIINDKDSSIKHLNKIINECNKVIDEKSREIDSQSIIIVNQNRVIDELNNKLSEIYSSKRWKLIDKIGNIINKIIRR